MNNFSLSADMPNDPRQKSWDEQQEKYGFDNTELWNLDVTFSKFVLPRLKRFIEITQPEGEFLEDLNHMVSAFEISSDGRLKSQEESQIIARGLKLFADNFQALWC